MDPRQKGPFLDVTFSSGPARTPRQLNLILTVLRLPGNSVFSPVSGLVGCALEKGPLIAGFSVFSSHFSIIDPFEHNLPKVMKTGSKGSKSGSEQGQKGPETGLSRPY